MTRASLLRHALRRATVVAAIVTLTSSLTVAWMETAEGDDGLPGASRTISFPALPPAGPDAAPPRRAVPELDAAASALPDAASVVPLAASASAAGPLRRRAARPVAAKHLLVGKLNLNTASAAQLDLLPRIGPTKAARVVAWRKAHGRFRRVRDLRRVKGFGRKTLEKLAPYLRVTGPTTLEPARL